MSHTLSFRGGQRPSPESIFQRPVFRDPGLALRAIPEGMLGMT